MRHWMNYSTGAVMGLTPQRSGSARAKAATATLRRLKQGKFGKIRKLGKSWVFRCHIVWLRFYRRDADSS